MLTLGSVRIKLRGLSWWFIGLRVHLAMKGTLVPSLGWEDPTCTGKLSPCTTTNHGILDLKLLVRAYTTMIGILLKPKERGSYYTVTYN